MRRGCGVLCRGELLTGCVPVNGVDKCFTGDLAAGPATCAKAVGGYNLTSFAGLLAQGKGADGREGSLCDPKVRLLHPFLRPTHTPEHFLSQGAVALKEMHAAECS